MLMLAADTRRTSAGEDVGPGGAQKVWERGMVALAGAGSVHGQGPDVEDYEGWWSSQNAWDRHSGAQQVTAKDMAVRKEAPLTLRLGGGGPAMEAGSNDVIGRSGRQQGTPPCRAGASLMEAAGVA